VVFTFSLFCLCRTPSASSSSLTIRLRSRAAAHGEPTKIASGTAELEEAASADPSNQVTKTEGLKLRFDLSSPRPSRSKSDVITNTHDLVSSFVDPPPLRADAKEPSGSHSSVESESFDSEDGSFTGEVKGAPKRKEPQNQKPRIKNAKAGSRSSRKRPREEDSLEEESGPSKVRRTNSSRGVTTRGKKKAATEDSVGDSDDAGSGSDDDGGGGFDDADDGEYKAGGRNDSGRSKRKSTGTNAKAAPSRPPQRRSTSSRSRKHFSGSSDGDY